MFGNREEERIIQPAIDAMRGERVAISWVLSHPTPPSPKAKDDKPMLTVCMYHDQGLIPVKAIAFESAVSVTLGLPIVAPPWIMAPRLTLPGRARRIPAA